MSEDLIKSIQNLIDSGKGDSERLGHILNTIKKGKPLFSSDQKYLDILLGEKIGSQQIETKLHDNHTNYQPINIRDGKKQVRKAVIGVIIAVIPIIILIYAMVNFTIPGLMEGNQRIIEANNGVDKASMDVLNACGDLYSQIQNIEVENGPGSDQLNQFVQGSSDSIKSCVTSLQSVQDSCKAVPSMQVCKDPKLQELSGEFSRFHP